MVGITIPTASTASNHSVNCVLKLGTFILPNVPGQTAEPWTLAFQRTSNRLVCSRWLGSVLFFICFFKWINRFNINLNFAES